MSRILAWMCLVLVAATCAYGLQLTAAAMVPSAEAEAGHQFNSTDTHRVLIVAVDPVTGDRAQMECDVPSFIFTTDVVFVQANEFPAVAQAGQIADQACELGNLA